jgi:cytochrome P450
LIEHSDISNLTECQFIVLLTLRPRDAIGLATGPCMARSTLMEKPERSGQVPVRVDIESPEYAAQWPWIVQDLRGRCPLAWSSEHGGYWLATRYRDVLRIAQDDGAFRSGKTVDPDTGEVDGGGALPPMPIPRMVPVETDRPEWDAFRQLINPALGPRAAERWRTRAREVADALIDQRIESGRMDLVRDLSSPLTAILTLELLGFPLGHWRRFADSFHELVYLNKSAPEFPAAVEAMEGIDRRILEEIAECRRQPRDDLISRIANGEVDGGPINELDAQRIVANLLSGGVDTTNALVAHTALHLWRHPEQRDRLAADRTLIPLAREEFVRFFAPIHGAARTASAPCRLAAQDIKAGERVFILYASANRDEKVFANGDEIDITRYPNRHIGFGAGIHRCVGSFFARVMFDEMLNAILDRLPGYVVHEAEARPYPSISPVNGWINLPISFTPAPRMTTSDPAWLAHTERSGAHLIGADQSTVARSENTG